MHYGDHIELDPPQMLCPFVRTESGEPDTCMGESCALWYRSTPHSYSGCSLFVTAFYACGVSYNSRIIRDACEYG